MAVTHSYTVNPAGDVPAGLMTSVTSTGTLGIQVDVPAAGSSTTTYTVAIDVTQVTDVFLQTDGALTVKVNDPDAPDQTLTFAAGKPLFWVSGMPTSCPLTTDVTALYLVNAGSTAVTLRGQINQDLP